MTATGALKGMSPDGPDPQQPRTMSATQTSMKEIKAYIRPEVLETVIRELENAGARDMTVIRVDAIGAMSGEDAEHRHLLRKYNAKYSSTAKLELVCRDDDADKYVKIICDVAHTGGHGDGRVFVSDIGTALNIRSGAEGVAAL